MTQGAHQEISQRRFPRRAFAKLVGVLYRGEYHLATAEEIGEGGISLYLPFEVKTHDEVVISLHIPGAEFVAVRAVLVNKRGSQGREICGFGFKNLSFERKREIRSFVSSRI